MEYKPGIIYTFMENDSIYAFTTPDGKGKLWFNDVPHAIRETGIVHVNYMTDPPEAY